MSSQDDSFQKIGILSVKRGDTSITQCGRRDNRYTLEYKDNHIRIRFEATPYGSWDEDLDLRQTTSWLVTIVGLERAIQSSTFRGSDDDRRVYFHRVKFQIEESILQHWDTFGGILPATDVTITTY